MSYEARVACGSLQRVERTSRLGHERQLRASDLEGSARDGIGEGPVSGDGLDEDPTFKGPAGSASLAEAGSLVLRTDDRGQELMLALVQLDVHAARQLVQSKFWRKGPSSS